jgi:hypothetical protein
MQWCTLAAWTGLGDDSADTATGVSVLQQFLARLAPLTAADRMFTQVLADERVKNYFSSTDMKKQKAHQVGNRDPQRWGGGWVGGGGAGGMFCWQASRWSPENPSGVIVQQQRCPSGVHGHIACTPDAVPPSLPAGCLHDNGLRWRKQVRGS